MSEVNTLTSYISTSGSLGGMWDGGSPGLTVVTHCLVSPVCRECRTKHGGSCDRRFAG
ncbi:hypothetical protein COCC4DRAFT_31941 [Bipolaris maydis ATCC 48331]|uniref:Uncharacterized protein n=2 Tax=Cochliobolus heterostrophus TaxID=5016 RepID=M2TQV6_COCH5|nr:uncharacterized protein COCC4DRAFT_31941 [Bipolaris maydis ATCC 48331]EMD88904.1 hypothetical protein COCHEDRAFT_1023086 [Bipolaris maydis C5]ENI05380.1 hypothetical protein COCC4DRAFT_31941 [Bipolaris maydis ATCC 48331]